MKINNPIKKVVSEGKVLFSGTLSQCHSYCEMMGIDVWTNTNYIIV
jgi:Rad3-related DNA helicase